MLPCTCFGPRTKRNVKQNQKLKGTADQKCIRDPSSSSAKPESASSSETPLRYEVDTKIFTYRELATATNDFKREALLGRGGFGAVFKGRLESTGQNVAVKMLDPSGAQGDKEFLVEVLMLSLLRHQNLVKLIGYCAEGDQRLLVYEYMPLGSLEDHLFESTFEKDVLDWSTRMQIAAGAARGLQHLHNEAQPAVIYRDLKSANILLDHNYKPKLSDFGLAKFGPGDNMTHVSTRVMGTHGYCAPEYANSGRLTAKSDIYSFGVVMLELISGRRAIGDSSIGPNRLLVNWARRFIVRNIKQIVDPMLSIQGRYMETTLKGALDLAFMCLREDANARPSISEIVNALDYIVGSLTRREKKKSIEHVQGVEPEQKATTVTVSSQKEMMNGNEKEVSEREKAVAEAKNWAENLRLRKPSNKPPTPSP